jgi:glycosyltransferase involved in cell wall biosynthesis
MQIAYFTNQYPAVSHTFIRREIDAMEELGVSVHRFALRAGANLVDEADKAELARTRFVLEAGIPEFLRCCAAVMFTQPIAVFSILRTALSMGWRSERGIFRHMAYVAEAAVLANWLKKTGVQHIHAHFGTNSAAVAMLASRLSGIPYSFTAHGSEEFEKAPLLSLDKKLEQARFAVCVSSFGRSQLMRWSSPDQWHKISVVHCGLDASFIERPVTAPPQTSRFVCVGRLDEHKAQIILVEAVRRLHDEGTLCEVVLVGDGFMREYVEEAIKRTALQEWITITGFVSGERVKKEIEAARALVLPSFSENMPVVIMEALALGRPVISTYVAGIPELVQPGKSGWLVPPSDVVALAQAMREALGTSIPELEAMGAAGRTHILEQHNVLKEARKLVGLLEDRADKA